MRFKAKADKSGSIRTLFLLFNNEGILAAVDATNRRNFEISKIFPQCEGIILDLKVPVSEYNRILKFYGKNL